MSARNARTAARIDIAVVTTRELIMLQPDASFIAITFLVFARSIAPMIF